MDHVQKMEAFSVGKKVYCRVETNIMDAHYRIFYNMAGV